MCKYSGVHYIYAYLTICILHFKKPYAYWTILLSDVLMVLYSLILVSIVTEIQQRTCLCVWDLRIVRMLVSITQYTNYLHFTIVGFNAKFWSYSQPYFLYACLISCKVICIFNIHNFIQSHSYLHKNGIRPSTDAIYWIQDLGIGKIERVGICMLW